MIPIRPEQGPQVTIPDTTANEEFVSATDILSVLSRNGYSETSARKLWSGFDDTCGVEFRNTSNQPAYVYAGGMACIRMLMDGSSFANTDRMLISIDGLVDGLTSGELQDTYSVEKYRITAEKPFWNNALSKAHSSPFTPRRLAMIAVLGKDFTPDRKEEIDHSVEALRLPVQ
jgi:hypothetical protein